MTRQKTFWIFGNHTVESAIRNRKNQIVKIILKDQKKSILFEGLKVVVDPIFIKKNFKNTSHQGIVAEVIKTQDLKLNFDEISKKDNLLVMDGINDVRNIGSIFRSALAFGFKDIIINKKDYNSTDPNLYKSASGAIENLNIYNVTNVKYEINQLKKRDFTIYAFDSNSGEELTKVVTHIKKNNKKFIFIFGSEKKGVRQVIRKECDEIIKIKMSSEIDSLNVSNAASIAMAMYYNLNF